MGKVADLFAGRGVAHGFPTRSDDDGMDRVLEVMATNASGLIFANLVDFDALYGHRNDVAGYAAKPRAVRRPAAGAAAYASS